MKDLPAGRRGRYVALLALLVALPPVVNLACGLTCIWTPALLPPLFGLLVDGGVIHVWLLLDLLAASGVLGGLAVVAAAAGRTAVAACVLATVASLSLVAAAATPAHVWPAGYGLAYTMALMLLTACSPARRRRFRDTA